MHRWIVDQDIVIVHISVQRRLDGVHQAARSSHVSRAMNYAWCSFSCASERILFILDANAGYQSVVQCGRQDIEQLSLSATELWEKREEFSNDFSQSACMLEIDVRLRIGDCVLKTLSHQGGRIGDPPNVEITGSFNVRDLFEAGMTGLQVSFRHREVSVGRKHTWVVDVQLYVLAGVAEPSTCQSNIGSQGVARGG